ncbi:MULTISPECIES: hypothetical protein [unclassified Coleofasciculus]|uniref:hypothetical protein n=1 Tax=unclassified Coleofasciculus TaxID=2692782 RepID=UPI00188119AF|nr:MULTISPECIES: hypothetical protein [unclassified Coleofasciculus]MBE9124774.1 hypothetical protein [Coleofasciculus sp. LEGE 07081]MBE9148226.1 hypothetical protein [Coleofasciculus sp. LEGE 07092]
MPGLIASLSERSKTFAQETTNTKVAQLGQALQHFEDVHSSQEQQENIAQQERVEKAAPLLVEAMKQAGTNQLEGVNNIATLEGNRLLVKGAETLNAIQDKDGTWKDQGSDLSEDYVEQLEENLAPHLKQNREVEPEECPQQREDIEL